MDLRALRQLNFKDLIEYDLEDVEGYCFEQYSEKGDGHPAAKSYCTACEEAVGEGDFHRICDEEGFRLCYISHGSTTEDFFASSTDYNEVEGWHEGAVMFVMENPSKCHYEGYNEIKRESESYEIYEKCPVTKGEKRYEKWPAKKWYWIHREQRIGGWPGEYVGGKYGGLVAAIINDFQLKDAYMTNLVKCGLNNPDKDLFRNTGSYDQKCIVKCMDRFLLEEIKAVNPKVIFAFGSSANYWLKKLKEEKGVLKTCPIVDLPHPAKRSLPHRFFQTLYFCRIAKWLYRTGVIEKDFYVGMMLKYAKESDWKEDTYEQDKSGQGGVASD